MRSETGLLVRLDGIRILRRVVRSPRTVAWSILAPCPVRSCAHIAAARCRRGFLFPAPSDRGRRTPLVAQTSRTPASGGWRALAVTLAAIAICGCDDQPRIQDGFSSTRDPVAFTEQEVQALLAQSGMSADQREIVERAGESGVVSFADYQAAVTANIECLQDAGLNPRDVETTTNGGQAQILYVIGSAPGLTEDANQQLIDVCAQTNSSAVEQLYLRNPGAAQLAVEVQDAIFAVAITECLTAGGYTVSDSEGATWRDLAGKVIFEQTDTATVTCILDTGVAETGLVLPKPQG